MIIVVVTHDANPGKAADAARRIDDNGAAMAQLPGYLFRYRMSPPDDQQRLVTITAWRDQNDFDRWNARKSELPSDPNLSGKMLYAKVTREVFQVDHSDVK